MKEEIEYINNEINSKIDLIKSYQNIVNLSPIDRILMETAEMELRILQSIWSILKRQKVAA